MFKLLTEEHKVKVRKEYSSRLIVVVLSAFVFVLITGLIGLMPSYILSDIKYREVASLAEDAALGGSEKNEDEIWFEKMKLRLNILNPDFDTDRPSEFVEKVIGERGTGIRLAGFSWIKGKDDVSLMVRGVADTRQDLIAFEERVKASEEFSNVSLPISNLASDSNIEFSLTFNPAP